MTTGTLQHYFPAGRVGLYLRSAAALLLVAAFASGCKAFVAESVYQPAPLPADVTELYRVFGDAGADTVWIYEQGGPVHMLEDDPLQQFGHYPGRDAVLFAQVHQTLTIDNDLVSRHRELSFEELQAEVDVSVEILHRVIEHFKAQGQAGGGGRTLLRCVPHRPLPVAQGARCRRTRCRSRSGRSWSCASWEPRDTTATRSVSPAPI